MHSNYPDLTLTSPADRVRTEGPEVRPGAGIRRFEIDGQALLVREACVEMEEQVSSLRE
ncbi:MAG TPA: hypothetical protein VK869_14225 [Rubrobacteraceae bacterium]|nr:hypothetical protein [Rubrobacteraceae bacterium]